MHILFTKAQSTHTNFANTIFEERKSNQTNDTASYLKPALKACADISLLLGHLNWNLSNLCRECVTPELNSS